MIVFSAKNWEGEYWSRDIPNGVETSPYTSRIFVVPALQDTPARQVADVGGRADFPHYSPDAAWVYFQAPVDKRYHIFRCREDGSEPANLTATHEPAGDRHGYKLSRDGKKMLFTFFDGQIGRVGIMNADGSEPRLIAPDIGYHYMADISPDNKSVVFAHTAKGYILTLKRLDTGEMIVLTPDHPQSYCPQFTPDGKTIVFTRRDGDVYRVDADGRNLKRLTQGNDYIHFALSPKDAHASSDFPSVSRGGGKIAYIAVKNGVSQVHTMDIDGASQRQVTSRKAPCGRAVCSPDGKWISFVSWEGNYTQLFIVPAGGGEPRKITDVHGAVNFHDWKPTA